ncbi:putative gamma interferon inducible lysosomal thiol reductase GILT [Helianthus annuus]|uniref:Gamma interferon inducible lysosomal thiol reductase GILT n=1 Tax=Helianthus annuus TaxID=4232 RepID=A0A9K3JV09_HELAN|nr:putative gamma interferon inducible lysosomal thiol reductase GILT [Helianthus annuus]KAJ0611344.1 putative gamma interferon inducible lysosomal thiol reductase GILT [Helianthus annuus]KAJ0626622.1 putative gamma interferon inducible lysosomal thiol reductase GILT [Helianthus annuus]KAJ0956594.1 putative gamma interferon inducible lysosomal thiol reductase GILT [Helianthus annuus]
MEARIFLIFIICLYTTINTCSSSSDFVEIIPVKEEAEKVQVKVYYESLCPYCENFIVNYLIDVFSEGIDAIADVHLFPYGNAKVNSNGNITCQHGEEECFFNTVEACAINTWPDVHDHFPFVYCVERYLYYGKFDQWESCFEELSLDPKPVKDCYSNGLGYQLNLQYADLTNSLEPPKKYVPWVVVDGKPLYDDYIYIITNICGMYKGPNLPKACFRCLPSPLGAPHDRVIPLHPVTYADDSSSPILSKLRSSLMSFMFKRNIAAQKKKMLLYVCTWFLGPE